MEERRREQKERDRIQAKEEKEGGAMRRDGKSLRVAEV